MNKLFRNISVSLALNRVGWAHAFRAHAEHAVVLNGGQKSVAYPTFT
jgi:hypothetical protein